jgi:ABC-type polar amino acid transport system ATPase subunit
MSGRKSLRIYVCRRREEIPNNADVLLEKDGWDDYGFETKYRVYVKDRNDFSRIGSVKIGLFGQKAKPDPSASTSIETGFFQRLPPNYFSLGQTEKFYEGLYALGAEFAREFLSSINDISIHPEFRMQVAEEDVYRYSLARELSESDIIQFQRLATGDTRKISYNFSYIDQSTADGMELHFAVHPDSTAPTNLHAIIGSNGVGKTTLFKNLVDVIGIGDGIGSSQIRFASDDVADSDQTAFKKIVFVSFSVFDQEQIARSIIKAKKLKAEFVGLLRAQSELTDEDELIENNQEPISDSDSGSLALMNRDDLFGSLLDSAKECMRPGNRKRWFDSLAGLSIDPLFEELNFDGLEDSPDFDRTLRLIFDRCSSGHAIALLATTRLVELVEERTLVLFDEPESHLHPPLLSALLNVVSRIVSERNAIAIVATHSPVVLQEVPRRCVWLLMRSGSNVEAYRPELETYGENVGVLTREVFELQLRRTGFNRLIHSLADEGVLANQILARLGGSLGSEGRALISTLTSKRKI